MLRAAAFVALPNFLVQLTSGEATSDHWCSGILWDAIKPVLGEDKIDVYSVQAPLFSSNPSIGDLLGQFNLYHTAVVFEQGDAAWTLEYDLTALNKAGATFADGYLPKIDGDKITWDSDARWCLTEGIHLGKQHWKKQYARFASITPSLFDSLVNEFVPSLNGSSSGVGYAYNLFQVKYALGPVLLDDVTCGNGAVWVRDFLAEQGAVIENIDWSTTRVTLQTVDGKEVDHSDASEWSKVVQYFSDLVTIVNSPASVEEKIGMLNKTLPVRYWHDSQTGRYFRISAVPTVSYDTAPLPWPKPTHHPISPTPPPAPGLDCTYTTDLDWEGDDLRDYSSDSKEECCRTCSTSDSCIAAVWKKNEIPIPRQGHCWLKSGVSKPTISTGRFGCQPAGKMLVI